MSLAAANQAAVRALTSSASRTAVDAWRTIDPEAVVPSWGARLPAVLAAVTSAQIAAASLAQPYVATAAAGETALGSVVASAFGGVASDGRALASLLFQPAIATILALAAGAPPRRAMASGLASLDMLVRTQVADANRLATGVAMAVDPNVIGYERQVQLPACGRCIVLAGRVYRWSTGFQRHPRCDCTMTPVTRAQHRETNLDNHPRALFDRMTLAQQGAAIGIANAQAVRGGADLGQVVNASRGMATAGSKGARPSPDQIYRMTSSREKAIELLRQHGYVL